MAPAFWCRALSLLPQYVSGHHAHRANGRAKTRHHDQGRCSQAHECGNNPGADSGINGAILEICCSNVGEQHAQHQAGKPHYQATYQHRFEKRPGPGAHGRQDGVFTATRSDQIALGAIEPEPCQQDHHDCSRCGQTGASKIGRHALVPAVAQSINVLNIQIDFPVSVSRVRLFLTSAGESCVCSSSESMRAVLADGLNSMGGTTSLGCEKAISASTPATRGSPPMAVDQCSITGSASPSTSMSPQSSRANVSLTSIPIGLPASGMEPASSRIPNRPRDSGGAEER